jgi:hypothetical protein
VWSFPSKVFALSQVTVRATPKWQVSGWAVNSLQHDDLSSLRFPLRPFISTFVG